MANIPEQLMQQLQAAQVEVQRRLDQGARTQEELNRRLEESINAQARLGQQVAEQNQIMQRLQTENNTLQQQAHGQAALLQPLSQLPNLIQALVDATQRKEDKPLLLVDNKGIGKPFTYDNSEGKFRAWAAKAEDFTVGVFGEVFRRVLEWAVDQDEIITKDMVEAAWGDEDDHEGDYLPHHEHCNSQLFSALRALTDGESFDIVNNVKAGNGLEAWRKLNKRFDPSTGGRRLNLLKAIMSPGKSKMEDLGSCLEKWEEQVGRYQKKKDSDGNRAVVSNDMKMAALEQLVPDELEKHLLLNRARLKSYDAMREEVITYFESVTGSKIKETAVQKRSKNPDAMDVDSLQKGGKGSKSGKGGKGDRKGGKGGKDGGKGNKNGGKAGGKGYGKGNSSQTQRFEGECSNCGKWGHKAKDCWSKSSGGQGAGKGKDAKGKGKGKSKDANAVDAVGASQPEPEAGSLDLCSILDTLNASATDSLGEVNSLEANSLDDEWLKLNYDTGAAMTAFPLEVAEGKNLKDTGEHFKTASGQLISDKGPVTIKGKDAQGNVRKMKGRVTEVHKALVAASQIHQSQDVWLGLGGGVMMPRGGPIAQGLHKEYERLVRKHGDKDLLPIYEERGVYNFYLKVAKKDVELAPLEQSAPSSPAPEDFRRQAQRRL
jgi:hypothetical protein